MMSFLRGVFLTSEKPEETAKFYREVAALELEEIGATGGYVYWKVDSNGLQIAIHDARKFAEYTYPSRPDSNLTHLYLKIENPGQFIDRLKTLGIESYATEDVVITVVEPDGRKVMFGTA